MVANVKQEAKLSLR